MELHDQIRAAFDAAPDKSAFVFELRGWISREISGHAGDPIDDVRWVPLAQVQANDYNPNSVAMNEMRLLYVSIQHDGLTQPIVTFYDPDLKKYIIVDGFHRYTTVSRNPDLLEKTGGCVPVVVIQKSIAERMASTVRHNRARGKHSVAGMGTLVFGMLQQGVSDEGVCNEIGLEADELLRLKHLTGFSKLFENTEYRKAWETRKQIEIRRKYNERANGGELQNGGGNGDGAAGGDPTVLAESKG